MVHAAFAAAAAAALLVPAVSAQAAAWAQCGGSSWTGATTCVSGYTCVYSNAYYSQCQPGTATTTVSSSTVTSTKTTTTSTKTTSTTAPTSTVDTSAHCGQYDTIAAGPYQLNTDLWGKASASSGSQCVHLTGLSGNTVSWSTYWKWTGSSSVVSYADVQLNQGLNKVLSTIKTIPSTAQWTNTAAGTITADVAYDLFTSATASGSNAYEIMIWLANYNAGPISSTYSSSGAPNPVASNIALGGYNWNLYYGSNGYNYVYSFLPVSGTIPSFSADINLFLKYLTTYQKLPANQYLTTLQFGTEATNGNATLTVSSYSAAIN